MSNDIPKDQPENGEDQETIELGPDQMAAEAGKQSIPKTPYNPGGGSWDLNPDMETDPTANYEPVPRPVSLDEIEEDQESARLLKDLVAPSPDAGSQDSGSESGGDMEKENAGWGSRYIKIVAALVLTGFVVWMVPNPGWRQPAPVEDTQAEMAGDERREAQSLQTTSISFYVPDSDLLYLTAKYHPVNLPGMIEKRIQIVLTELFAEKNAVNTLFPQGMAVRGVYVSKATAIVSLTGGFRKNYHTGAWTELLAVYSIVNTVTGAFEEIGNVILLIDDEETELFVSHVDISGALYPDRSLVKVVKKQAPAPRNDSGGDND